MLRRLGIADCRLPEFEPKIDETSENHAWKVLHRDSARLGAKQADFAWRQWQFALRYEKDQALLRLTVSATGPGEAWQAVLCEVDTTPKNITAMDYDELCNIPSAGHRRSSFVSLR